MPPVKRDFDMDFHDSRQDSFLFIPPDEKTIESGIESGSESTSSRRNSSITPRRSSSTSSSSSPRGNSPRSMTGRYGLLHEDNCGCPATDLQGMVIVRLENENRQLRSRLEQSEHTMSEMSHQMELQKSRTRQLIAGWKIKLQEGEEKMVAHSKEKDDQLASLLSQLMYFEGCLKREREDITEELLSKTVKISDLEKTVKHQKKQIDALNRANERLLTSLHDTMNGRTGDASDESSSDDDSSSSSSNNSPVPMMVRRKASMPAAVTLTKLTNGNISNYSRPRQRKGVANGSTPTIHIVHVDSPDQQLSSDSTSPELTRRRVHFEPHLQNNNRGEDTDSDENKRKRNVRLRKISLPAYRLPSDEEGSIRYF